MKKLAFALAGTLLLFVHNSYAQRLPNFIVIYADDMGYGDLGINGNPSILTPNLDRMAAEGVRFSNYYSASPACTASRYAFLTGKYPPRSGFRWVLYPTDKIGLHPKEQTIAEALKEKGYHTAVFGKWHLGSTDRSYMPLAQGFDEYVGLPYSNDMIPPKHGDIPLLHGYDTLELNPDQSKLTKLYTERSISFIEKNKSRPFFVYLPYAMPHVPLFASTLFKGTSPRGLYGDVVQELDFYIGKLTSYLEESGLDKNTFVIFTSDNGPWLLRDEEGGSAGLFRDGKGSTWEGGMREPFILWGHRDLPKGKVVGQVFTSLDLMPTIASLAGISQTENPIDGKAFPHLWKGEGQGRSEFYFFGINHQLMAVRKGPWKLHVKTYSQLGIDYFEKGKPLLFNLDKDPSEKYNVAEHHPEIVNELKSLIRDKETGINSAGSFWDKKNITGK
ncbi:MAG: sulfatase [Niabella sp.]